MGLTDERPHGWLRFAFRLPLGLYRVGLGRLLGHRFLRLVHTGRKSGLPRAVVLEVVGFDRRTPEAFVVAAWGERADWYRNLAASPAREVRIGAERWPRPRHRVLTESETLRLLDAYRARHRVAWKQLAQLLGLPLDPHDPAAGPALAGIRAVALTPAA